MYLYCQIGHLERALHLVGHILGYTLAGVLKIRNAKKWEYSWIKKFVIRIVKANTRINKTRNNKISKSGFMMRPASINTKKESLITIKSKNNKRINLGGFLSVTKGFNKFASIYKKIKNYLKEEATPHSEYTLIIIAFFIIGVMLCFKLNLNALLGIPLFLISSVLLFLFGKWIYDRSL